LQAANLNRSSNTSEQQLGDAIANIARAQGHAIDPLRLRAALAATASVESRYQRCVQIAQQLSNVQLLSIDSPDPARLPLLAVTPEGSWAVVEQWRPDGTWIVRSQGTELGDSLRLSTEQLMGNVFGFDFASQAGQLQNRTFKQAFKQALKPYRSALFESVFASAFIGFIALAISLFSMQVYDRVIPTRSTATLITLSVGVALAILLELAMKMARSKMMNAVSVGVDSRANRDIFERLMSVRVDAIPASVGSLAAQLRGFEQVRNFYTANTLFSLVDVPLGIAMLFLLGAIAGPWVALVPASFALVALALGFILRRQVMKHSAEGADVTNRKTGLLVEALEGAQTIKAGGGGWKFLSRWIDLSHQTMRHDIKVKHTSESLSYYSASLQQLAYSGLIAAGSVQVMQGNMTMGALIACSIISGRIMAPILGLPNLIVQQAHAKAAMDGLERLYSLSTDNQGVQRPLMPQTLAGQLSLKDVSFAYPDSPDAFAVERIDIKAGERVGILGPIGSGKSTLLKMLAGLYTPSKGRVLIDGLDMAQVARSVLTEHVGYLQQEHRLFQGTLRDNLLIGMNDPGDDALQQAMTRSGLLAMVSNHPKGLELPISEGGNGLSGGQRQLVAFTRLLLSNPSVLLLDEPTANMDDSQERRCLSVLEQMMQQTTAGETRRTTVIVTHKPSLLPLVDRLIVVQNGKLMLDGPRDAVLARLRQGEINAKATTTAAVTPSPIHIGVAKTSVNA
jgi:ATP-binding cassette, subfamily C, bacterial LapB